MMTTASCETFGSTLCAEVGGTPKAGFCNTNGLFCSAMNLSVANECARDSDCIDPVRPTYCCDFETQKFKTFCDNIDTAKLETYLADSTSCHDPECSNSPPFSGNTGNVNLSGSGSGGGKDESGLSPDMTLGTFVRQLIQRVQLACFMDGDTMCFPKYLSLVTSDGFENGLSNNADLANRLSELCDPCFQKLMKGTADQQTANMLDLMCAKDLDVSIRLDQKEF